VISLAIVLAGAWAWLRVVRQWRICFKASTTVIRSYLAVSVADGIFLLCYLLASLEGLAVSGTREWPHLAVDRETSRSEA
jgi:hypothetical protein